VLGVPFVSEQVALSAVEPAVAYLTAPLLSLHGPDVAAAVSATLVSLLLPFSGGSRRSPAVVFTDTIGQVCVRLRPADSPLVVWPLAVGLVTPKDAPKPCLCAGTKVEVSSSYAVQASRTRLLVRSLVLQSAMDLMALAKATSVASPLASTPSKRRKPGPLTIAVPAAGVDDEDMTLVEIIRTAVPVEVSTFDLDSPSAAFPPHLAAVAAGVGSRFSMASTVSVESESSPSSTPTASSTPHAVTTPTASTPSLTDTSSSASDHDEWDLSSSAASEASAIMVLEPILFSPLYLGDFASLDGAADASPAERKPEARPQERLSWWSGRSARGV
jgi:hypothetical protein